jgi:hypothetical protein
MIVIRVGGLNGKALKETGRCHMVANCVSDGNAAHGSSASLMEMTKMIENIFL